MIWSGKKADLYLYSLLLLRVYLIRQRRDQTNRRTVNIAHNRGSKPNRLLFPKLSVFLLVLFSIFPDVKTFYTQEIIQTGSLAEVTNEPKVYTYTHAPFHSYSSMVFIT